MIQPGSVLQCVDGSGAKLVRCLMVIGRGGGARQKYAKLGDKFKLAVQSFNGTKRAERSTLYSGMVVGQRSAHSAASARLSSVAVQASASINAIADCEKSLYTTKRTKSAAAAASVHAIRSIARQFLTP